MTNLPDERAVTEAVGHVEPVADGEVVDDAGRVRARRRTETSESRGGRDVEAVAGFVLDACLCPLG
jgi:hypothetical protein